MLGAGHDADDNTNRYPDSHGFSARDGAGTCVFGTLMAYDCAVGRITFFSNLVTKYGGLTVGDAMHNNARAVAEIVEVAGNYR